MACIADDSVNTGQDLTRPLTRVDLRAGYVQPGGTDFDVFTFIARADAPFELGGGWRLGTRIDLPFILSDVPSADNRNGSQDFGFGDTLAQAILIRPLSERAAVGFGSQVIAPTATSDSLGAGKWRLVPTAGARYSLPEITPGSFALFGVRYDVDLGGDDDRPSVSELQFAPTLNIALPHTSFLTIFPSTDIRYSFREEAWFVPFNAQIGKLWGGNVVTSLEAGIPLIDDYEVYDFKIEARIGFFF
jgi:hypothetical protein